MIQAFATRYQKPVAAFFLYVLLLEIILPSGLYAREHTQPTFHRNHHTVAMMRPVQQQEEKPAPVLIHPEINLQRSTVTLSQGPGQPEMQTFQSVNTNNMVDLFTGDFSYNIPLLDVGGYPVGMHYRSGITMDQEASWVGLGWNINPGTISRNMRGVPDDFNGETIEKTTSIRPNWTVGVTADANPELFGKELKTGINAGIFYNNYAGIGIDAGLSLSLSSGGSSAGALSSGLGISLQNNSQSGIGINPSFSLMLNKIDRMTGGWDQGTGFTVGTGFSTRKGLQSLTISGQGYKKYTDIIRDQKGNITGAESGTASGYPSSTISFAHQGYTPKANVRFSSVNYNFRIKAGGELFGFHPLAALGIYYSKQQVSTPTVQVPAYGYLNLQNGKSNPKALIDFNREKELSYHANPATPHLAIPNYTYDIYSITGEGTGGMFRPYRGDIGYARDPEMVSSSSSAAGGSVDLGAGNLWHGGVDVRLNNSTTAIQGWTDNNEMVQQIPFNDADTTFENVYFKNPSEKTINGQDFYDKIGDTYPVLPVMDHSNDPVLTPYLQPYQRYNKYGKPVQLNAAKSVKLSRDKRSQVISFLNAEQASFAALDRMIRKYPVNQYFAGACDMVHCDSTGTICDRVSSESRTSSFRKNNHLSEITVLNADGRRYIYGLPVYNIEQNEVSFSVYKNKADLSTGMVSYTPGSENSINNNAGKDNYYNKEKIPPYAHSFLLTAVVSPDYVDRLGDGITDDDQGDAVKFNYSQVYNANNPYRWRMPYDAGKASYNEMLKTDNSDDKGTYTYGTKEVWYLNSIESKTMIATFVLNDPGKGEVRQDGNGVTDENGGMNTAQGLRYLKAINLYSKADYLKNRDKAIPVKTVHFDYSYDLCKGAPGSIGGNGKLTLVAVWFTYNGNDKGKKNPYVFTYHPNNPSYAANAYDRWGNYKNAADNPGGLSNADYPYTLQTGTNNWNAAKAASNAGAWTLTDIKMPSGGKMHVDYESDDYAYVQNQRAGQMMQLAGFGNSNDFSAADQFLYNGQQDRNYVFIKVPVAAAGKNDVFQKYLQGINSLYFNYRVVMPGDVYGSGSERVSTYARFDDYGVSSTDPTIIWIHLLSADGATANVSPLTRAAIQTLKLNLPSKAYPGSDLNGAADPVALGKSLVGFLFNFSELLANFSTRAKILGKAREVVLNNSFARLDNPGYQKLGGGLRVKKITVSDNWDTMTGLQQKAAIYGQEYDYTTTQLINGVPVKISSGVASYEPGVGNDENSLRQPIEYGVQVAPLAPVENYYSETPLGESFYPAASVGYSKVRVHTINNKVQSANGYEETEFYTSYDFPTITEYTPVDERKFSPSFLSQLLHINTRRYLAQTQGFKVEINDMNGKEKGHTSYAQHDSLNPISYTKYYYKVDDEQAVTKHLSNTVAAVQDASGVINPNAQIGKDIELMTDMREELSQTHGVDLEFNVDGFLLVWPVAIPTLWPLPQSETDRYRSAATMKLVQRYGILDKVLQYEKGSLVTTENQLYDAETGDVLLTKTQNEFNDPVYHFNTPAHWAYNGMGPAYKNQGTRLREVTFQNGKIQDTWAYYHKDLEHLFESGDEILVRGIPASMTKQLVDSCAGEIGCTSLSYNIYNDNVWQTAWAVDASKIQGNAGAKGIYFVDSTGNFFSSWDCRSVQVIHSGKRNMASKPIGSVVSLSSPVRTVNNRYQLVFDDTTRVIQTAANTFKDFWPVEDAKYRLTKTTVVKKNAVYTQTFTPATSYSISHHWDNGGGDNNYYGFYGQDFFEGSTNVFVPSTWLGGRGDADGHIQKSWLHFNLQSIPANAKILKAQLSLQQHLGTHSYTSSSQIRDGSDNENHPSSSPHRIYDAVNINGSNQCYIGRVQNALFNGMSVQPGIFYDGSTFLSTLFNNSNVDAATKTIVAASIKQNSVLADVTSMVRSMLTENTPTVIEMGDTYTDQTGSVNENHINRLCFWSKDHLVANTGPCQAGGTTQSTFVYAPATTMPPHGPAMVATDSSVCPTAPQLTITYQSCTDGDELQRQCDSVYCIKRVYSDTCISAIRDTAVNPYRWGILGNWRSDKSYVFYNARKENDPAAPTDIRNNGVLNGFAPYWNYNGNGLQASADTFHWVWNAKITQFNRKGFEIENTDPLGRYNAAQYGYQQTLPVAVTQNARYNEQAYDGFEDYGFNNNSCVNLCPVNRHLNFSGAASRLTDSVAHTGRYSLALQAANNETVNADIPVNDPAFLNNQASLLFKIDTVLTRKVSSFSGGMGLKATFSPGYDYMNDNNGLGDFNYTTGVLQPTVYNNRGVDYNASNGFNNVPNFYYNATGNNIVPSGQTTNYKVVWEGFMLPFLSGKWLFKAVANNTFKMWIDNKLVIDAFPNDPVNGNANTFYSDSIRLIMGRPYSIRVEHIHGTGVGEAHLYWAYEGEYNYPPFYYVMSDALFQDRNSAANAVRYTSDRCIMPGRTKVNNDNMLIKSFSPAPASSFVVGAWVKEEQDCYCQDYKDAQIAISFYDSSGNTINTTSIKPSGNLVERWQRLEGIVTVPAGAKNMRLSLQSTSQNNYSGKVYFDDVRIHPYHANMKSYAYDPVSLRLMADLDENNYASFYEYDDDGTLIRVKKETEQGIKTIKETRSALLKQ